MFANTTIGIKKALTPIIAAAALVTVAVPSAHATLDRSLPTSTHVKITKSVKVTWNTVTRSSGAVASDPLCALGDYCVPLSSSPTIDVPAPAPTSFNVGAGT